MKLMDKQSIILEHSNLLSENSDQTAEVRPDRDQLPFIPHNIRLKYFIQHGIWDNWCIVCGNNGFVVKDWAKDQKVTGLNYWLLPVIY